MEVCMTNNEDEERVNRRRSRRYAICLAAGLMSTLASGAVRSMSAPQTGHGVEVVVDNFTSAPATTTVSLGTTVTWTNHDDIPHNVVSTERKFKSPVVDTNEMAGAICSDSGKARKAPAGT